MRSEVERGGVGDNEVDSEEVVVDVEEEEEDSNDCTDSFESFLVGVNVDSISIVSLLSEERRPLSSCKPCSSSSTI
jgi:hypothetical protein